MKRSLFILLVSILVGSTGCLTSDNNVGSLGNDSGPADGPPVLMTPTLPAACTTDGDCCVAMDPCMDVAYLVGQAEYGSMVTSIANVNNTRSPSACLRCIPPSVQVQCKGGVCVGEEIPFSPSRSASLISSHCGYVNLSDAGAGSGSTKSIWRCSSTSADAAVSVDASTSPEAGSVAKDAAPDSPLPDSAAPDAASVGNDAAPASPETGPAHRCQVSGGTCTATTPDTACMPFTGRLYDEGAGCYSAVDTILGCCATAAGETCALPTASGCYESATVSTIAYWTPYQWTAAVEMLPGGQPCASPRYGNVASAHPCGPAAADAASAPPEAGSAHQCQLNGDGTCVAVTPNTACTPFNARRYDESGGCLATNWTTLWCCATAAGDSCGWPAATGCYQVAADGGTVTYWTPALPPPSPPLSAGQACDQSTSAKVSSASVSLCAAGPVDAAAPPDAHVPVILPLCATDNDCCVSVNECMATATLTGNDGYGPVPGTHDSPGTCLACIVPAIQVQCQAGFCVGTRLSGIYDSSSPLLRSHCGHIALPDAGAAVSPHAAVDAGLSYQTTWTCGSY